MFVKEGVDFLWIKTWEIFESTKLLSKVNNLYPVEKLVTRIVFSSKKACASAYRKSIAVLYCFFAQGSWGAKGSMSQGP